MARLVPGSTPVPSPRFAVLGFGNIRLEDCGLAATVLEALAQEPLGEDVCLVFPREKSGCLASTACAYPQELSRFLERDQGVARVQRVNQ